jgi:hypothetical protein
MQRSALLIQGLSVPSHRQRFQCLGQRLQPTCEQDRWQQLSVSVDWHSKGAAGTDIVPTIAQHA